MSEEADRLYKHRAATLVALVHVVSALIKSHPNPEALKSVWMEAQGLLGAADMKASESSDLGEDPEQTALLQSQIQGWTRLIHQSR